jgi:hypothetical protein
MNESSSYLNLSLFTTLLTERPIPCTTQDEMSLTLDGEACHCNEFHSEIFQGKREVCYFTYILILANMLIL